MRVKGAFFVVGGKRENPPRERLGAGDAAAFSYDIGLFRGFQRAMETDEVCGRPLDAFAFTSHVTMEKTGLGERMTDQHAGIVCSCHQLNRAKGSREGTSSRFILPCRVQGQRPCWGQGAKHLGSLFSVNPNKRRENQKNMWKCGTNYDIIGMLAPEKGEKRGIKGGN